MCAWGPGGKGTLERPYYRWPGALGGERHAPQPMRLAEVGRPAEIIQFADGSTVGYDLSVWTRHQNGMLNGAFVDGHVRRVTEAEWYRVRRDDQGYFYYAIAAADR